MIHVLQYNRILFLNLWINLLSTCDENEILNTSSNILVESYSCHYIKCKVDAGLSHVDGSFASCVWQINQDREPGHKIPLIGNKLLSILYICSFRI